MNQASKKESLESLLDMGSRPKLRLIEPGEAQYLAELGKVAKEIIELKQAFNNLNTNHEEYSADRVALRLTSAEQEFFLLFNTLRKSKGIEPLKGKRFSGDFSYESYLYNH
ncbi:hypothetical protein PU629_19835 [Pullulanibacillus sp. KACC 23026]|uniref:hypothetical protein n=1 Tax=Pullulanibacillus sp. KACC 23026 TaxID=3028315 RepID=UPI0023AF488A|nr:hypothetical protein [Pullulanibacillus sp. KACC 23026]WEG12319.1 hypothetical protein PU629_19835 [Pullulanibacillus sp. KACC 23026]